MPPAPVCPNCNVQLQPSEASAKFSFGLHVAWEVVGGILFFLVLPVLASWGLPGLALAALGTLGVVLLVIRYTNKRSRAEVVTQYSCPQCYRRFYENQLHPTRPATPTNAP